MVRENLKKKGEGGRGEQNLEQKNAGFGFQNKMLFFGLPYLLLKIFNIDSGLTEHILRKYTGSLHLELL